MKDDFYDDERFYKTSTIEPLSLSTVHKMMLRAFATALAIKQLHWIVSGKGFGDNHEFLDQCYNELLDDADYWGELGMETQHTVPDILQGLQGLYTDKMSLCIARSGSIKVLTTAKMFLDAYIELLQQARDEYNKSRENDIVSKIDDRVRMWRKQVDYFLTARL